VRSPTRSNYDQAFIGKDAISVVDRASRDAVGVCYLAHRGELCAALPFARIQPTPQSVKYANAWTFGRSAHVPMITVCADMILCLPRVPRRHARYRVYLRVRHHTEG
jgi:hypothetical protein